MIKYLGHSQIDKIRWDDCISKSFNRRVYAFSWYLDLVCKGWDGLVEDDYVSVFPLTHNRKWAISYLFQPWFSQQLGIFSHKVLSEGQVFDFIQAVPRRFRLIDIHLNSMNSIVGVDGQTSLRINHELNLLPGYSELSGKYSQNTSRNLRKAKESAITLSRSTGVDELIGLFRENFGKKEGKLEDCHYATLRQLIVYCLGRNFGHILGAKNNAGDLSSAAFFLFDQKRAYFLFAASSPDARDNGAMFFLIDRFIAENSGKGLILDFEGGDDPDLGRFYKSFGAREVPYPALSINRLSSIAERGLYFMRKLRKWRKRAIFVRG